ncbi:MAG: hemerythrin domain-containing protein [Archangium sp.]
MDSLVETLRAQHLELDALSKALTVALHHEGDVARVRDALQAYGAALLQHLALEDENLYPRLLESVDRRSPDARMIRTFADNMKRVSEGAKVFLSRSVESPADVAALKKEWPDAQHLLASRRQSEERLLYPMFEERVRPA